MHKSLHLRRAPLSDVATQRHVLASLPIPEFNDTLIQVNYQPLTAGSTKILQMNLGKMCNQVCAHCHVDAGPDRREIMSREIMQDCISVIKNEAIQVVDLTGGAPEMNPHFRWLVSTLRDLNVHVMVRCNLTIILANKKYHDLPQFFKDHQVEVISSLPCYTEENTDAQRGLGVFNKSIEALRHLNEVGYGKEGSGLILNLVYNPGGAFLPPDQSKLEQDYKKRMFEDFGVVFNQLLTITNMPISRFLEYLNDQGQVEEYAQLLHQSFNLDAVSGLMCRYTVSIGWDGRLYDCDFNQMLELPINTSVHSISEWALGQSIDREICTAKHCYGCTAGAGSGCGGALL